MHHLQLDTPTLPLPRDKNAMLFVHRYRKIGCQRIRALYRLPIVLSNAPVFQRINTGH